MKKWGKCLSGIIALFILITISHSQVISSSLNESIFSIEDTVNTLSIAEAGNISEEDNINWGLKRIEADKAWKLIKQVRQIKVAVVDSGVDYNHPALKDRIDIENGYNFVNNTSDAMDDNGHGTHVAGIIAAVPTENSKGFIGVAGNLDVKIIPVKVVDKDGFGSSKRIAKGIRWAADKGADIINLSLYGKGSSAEINFAIQYAYNKGILVIAAAGNENDDCNNYTPASSLNVVTVLALDKQNEKAGFSNYGSKIELSAPGVDIFSTLPNNSYGYMSGTSMAAPMVAGAAALIKAQNPDLTASEIRQLLDDSAVALGESGKNSYYGFGLVNIFNATKKCNEFICIVKNNSIMSCFCFILTYNNLII